MEALRILLVEDDADDELLTLRALKRDRIVNEIHIARDGAEALDFLLRPDPTPTLVLLDLHLPKLDGLEVLRRLRAHERTRCLPVILLTDSQLEEEKTVHEVCAADHTYYLRKPLDFARLAQAILKLRLRWVVLSDEETNPSTQPALAR